jgi:hypothetical protein
MQLDFAQRFGDLTGALACTFQDDKICASAASSRAGAAKGLLTITRRNGPPGALLVLRTIFSILGKCSNYTAMHRCEGVSVKVGSTSRNDGGYRAFVRIQRHMISILLVAVLMSSPQRLSLFCNQQKRIHAHHYCFPHLYRGVEICRDLGKIGIPVKVDAIYRPISRFTIAASTPIRAHDKPSHSTFSLVWHFDADAENGDRSALSPAPHHAC